MAQHIVPIALLVGFLLGFTYFAAWWIPVLTGFYVLILRRSFYSLVWLGSPIAGLAALALIYGLCTWDWNLELLAFVLVPGIVGFGIMGYGAWKALPG